MSVKKILFLAKVLFIYMACSAPLPATGKFPEFNPNARINGLGSAGAAIDGISTPLVVSPASLGINNQPKLSFFYGCLSTATHVGYVEYDYPFTTWAALGAATRVKYLDKDNYSRDLFFGLSVDLFNGFSMGTSGGLISETLYGNAEEAVTVGAGIFIAPFN